MSYTHEGMFVSLKTPYAESSSPVQRGLSESFGRWLGHEGSVFTNGIGRNPDSLTPCMHVCVLSCSAVSDELPHGL